MLKDYKWKLEGTTTVYDDLVLTDCIITISSITFNVVSQSTRIELRFMGETSHIRDFELNIDSIDELTENNIINAVAEEYPTAQQVL